MEHCPVKLAVAQLVEAFPAFVKLDGSLAWLYSPHVNPVCSLPFYFFNINFSMILLSMSGSSKWSLSLISPTKQYMFLI